MKVKKIETIAIELNQNEALLIRGLLGGNKPDEAYKIFKLSDVGYKLEFDEFNNIYNDLFDNLVEIFW